MGTPDSGTATRPAGRPDAADATLADSMEDRWNGDGAGAGTSLGVAERPSAGARPPSCAASGEISFAGLAVLPAVDQSALHTDGASM